MQEEEALNERRQRIKGIRAAMKGRKLSGAFLARCLSKSPSQINAILRGNYPYYGGYHMPVYFERCAESFGLIGKEQNNGKI